MIRKLGLAVVAMVMAATVTTPANAEYARVCVAVGDVEFNPPLTTTLQTGTMTFTYETAPCVVVSTTSGVGTTDPNGSTTLAYSGSCLAATVTNPGEGITGVLVGGLASVTLQIHPSSQPLLGARAWVLLPTDPINPCAFHTGLGVNAGPDVWPGSPPA